ncbi:acyltransferase family protein [Amycolatopsis nigrescens]|uniref:acyltransferase family protein n=1 Tax=Amycolatopsis nigrescens TaxID=381445 RepID=UPI0003798057|nr:acyltransferase family protein [Amycolatopsis nigrescens]
MNVGFGWLRLAGAALVILDHSAALTRNTHEGDEGNAFPLGRLVLLAIFAMSGYQISGSWDRDPCWWRFAARRLLRLLPPLLVLLLITVLVLGPLLTTWSLGDYLTSRDTWQYLVGTFVLFLLQHVLPGVFEDNPYPAAVNGSLWTLPMEVVGYLIVLTIGLLVALGVARLVVLLPLLAGLMVLDGAFVLKTLAPVAWMSVVVGSLVAYMVAYVLGMVLYALRDRLPFSPLAAAALLILWLALYWTPARYFMMPAVAAYGAIAMARNWPAKWVVGRRWMAGSYGMYLWGFLVQQLIVAAGVRDPWLLTACAVPVAYLCGVLSWVLVEEPTQRWRRHLRPPRPPARQDARQDTVAVSA